MSAVAFPTNTFVITPSVADIICTVTFFRDYYRVRGVPEFQKYEDDD